MFARARTVHPHPQPIEPIVREAAEVVGPAAAQANVERVVEVQPDLPLVDADAELLRQAFLNLCVNAIQAMQERSGGGRLGVRARRDGDGVAVEISDTGPGIDAEARAHVFEPFFTTKADGHRPRARHRPRRPPRRTAGRSRSRAHPARARTSGSGSRRAAGGGRRAGGPAGGSA